MLLLQNNNNNNNNNRNGRTLWEMMGVCGLDDDNDSGVFKYLTQNSLSCIH
jgi:hypothetical protein